MLKGTAYASRGWSIAHPQRIPCSRWAGVKKETGSPCLPLAANRRAAGSSNYAELEAQTPKLELDGVRGASQNGRHHLLWMFERIMPARASLRTWRRPFAHVWFWPRYVCPSTSKPFWCPAGLGIPLCSRRKGKRGWAASLGWEAADDKGHLDAK